MPEDYIHRWIDGSEMAMPVGKIVCVGRNYADHARELGNEVPESPLLFMKGANALRTLHEPLVLPRDQGEVHHEVEMVAMIGKRLSGESFIELHYVHVVQRQAGAGQHLAGCRCWADTHHARRDAGNGGGDQSAAWLQAMFLCAVFASQQDRCGAVIDAR